MEKISLTPLVSVCVPAYNCAVYIQECIGSVLAQTYQNIEIIVVNDGSTDKTPVILEALKQDRVHIYHRQNAGAAAARNFAFGKSSGNFIKFLDGDDVINAEMIESQVILALENKNSVISSSWGRFYHDDLASFRPSPEECWQTLPACEWLISSWKNGHSMMQSGMFLLPRAIIEKAGYWDEQLSLIDDLDFFTRVILKSSGVVFDPAATLYYRSGISGSLSDHKQEAAIRSAFSSLQKATNSLLAVNSSPEARLASANIWQHFIYTAYPAHPDLVKKAGQKIKELGGSSLPFMAGGLTRILTALVGWKATARIKHLINRP
jgi:glycosyltransferase involved in cell wall biosynthesis